jgi:hypothetical protein
MPGFLYRVRPAGSKRLLFEGRSLRLISIGPGYGKRITFAPDETSLNASNNFLWSDSHPDGLGFEPRAVHAGMKFAVTAGGQRLGEGSVFRADAVQQEEKQELVCQFIIVFLQKENVYSVLMFSSQNIAIISYSIHTSPPYLMVICCNDNS